MSDHLGRLNLEITVNSFSIAISSHKFAFGVKRFALKANETSHSLTAFFQHSIWSVSPPHAVCSSHLRHNLPIQQPRGRNLIFNNGIYRQICHRKRCYFLNVPRRHVKSRSRCWRKLFEDSTRPRHALPSSAIYIGRVSVQGVQVA